MEQSIIRGAYNEFSTVIMDDFNLCAFRANQISSNRMEDEFIESTQDAVQYAEEQTNEQTIFDPALCNVK